MYSSEISATFCYVYLLHSRINGGIDIGFTHNLRKRFAEHNKGLSRFTKPYRPWELLFYKAHTEEKDARRREKYLKTTAGRQALRRILREKYYKLSDLSQQKVYY